MNAGGTIFFISNLNFNSLFLLAFFCIDITYHDLRLKKKEYLTINLCFKLWYIIFYMFMVVLLAINTGK